jgi:hypothetical protein
MARKQLIPGRFPGHSKPPQPPQQPQQPQQPGEAVYQIPFTIPEIDTVMQSLIEANVPIRTYMLLDNKFNQVKRRALLNSIPKDPPNESGEVNPGDK